MKITYIVALLMIVLMVGCATQTQPGTAPPAAPSEPETPAAPETPAEEALVDDTIVEEAEEPEEEAVVGDIVIKNSGFDPAEMTVTVGTTLTLESAEGRHKFTIGGKSTPIIEKGSAYDVTFDEVGEVTIFDIFTKKSAYVTVTEEAGGAME